MTEEKKKNPILWLMFAVIVPVILALVIITVGLSFAGINVGGWVKDKASNIPIVSSVIKTDGEKQLELELANKNEEIDELYDRIEDYRREIDSMESIIDDLEIDIEKARNSEKVDKELSSNNKSSDKLDDKKEKDVENSKDDKEELTDEEIKKAAASYRKMDPEKAAPIIAEMKNKDAVAILTSLPPEARGNILAEMKTKKAATLTKLMME